MRVVEAGNLQLLVDRWRRGAEGLRDSGKFDMAAVLDKTAEELQGLTELAVEVEL